MKTTTLNGTFTQTCNQTASSEEETTELHEPEVGLYMSLWLTKEDSGSRIQPLNDCTVIRGKSANLLQFHGSKGNAQIITLIKKNIIQKTYKAAFLWHMPV